MNEDRRKAFAEFDGYEWKMNESQNHSCWNYGKCHCVMISLYDNETDLFRLIRKMDEGAFVAFLTELCRLQVKDGEEAPDVFPNRDDPFVAVELLMRGYKATLEQLEEAIAKAIGAE